MRLSGRTTGFWATLLAVAIEIVTSWIVLSVTFTCVSWFAALAIASHIERQDPNAFETPLSAAGPLLAGAIVSAVLHIVVLGVLALFRVRFTKNLLATMVVGCASLLAIWYLALYAGIEFNGWYPVGFRVGGEYPVLVLTPDPQSSGHDAQLVEWSRLKAFCDSHPGYTFLVPHGEEDGLIAQLPHHDVVWAIQSKAPDDTLLAARFEATSLANGRQKIVADGSWMRNKNASVRSWYEAEDRKVYPRFITEGDTYTFYFLDAIGLVAALDCIGLIFYVRRRSKKAPGFAPFGFGTVRS